MCYRFHLLIIPSFALSEGDGGYGAPAHRGMNSQLPGSPAALLNFCLSRLLGLTQAKAMATCTECICCIGKSSVALLGLCQLVRDTRGGCWGWLSCGQLRTLSLPKAPGGLSLKPAEHQICSLLTPQGTKPHLRQPNKPRHWLAPFRDMG